MKGPIDFIVVGFTTPKFDGSILNALAEAIDKGIISLVALAVVHKDVDGVITTLDITDVGDDFVVQFAQKYPVSGDLVTQDDIEEIGDLLEADSAAAVLVVEQLWAKPLKKAIIDANGFLIADGRIHPEAVKELESEDK